MDFLGIDIDTPQGASAASKAHLRLVSQYMSLLDRYRKLPACEDLTFAELEKKGYPREFLESLESLTCLPPPGDSFYQGEDAPFELQYQEILDRMDRDPKEMEKQDKEFFESLSPREQDLAQAQGMCGALSNACFMLALDWSQVAILGALPFCPPRKQLELLSHLGYAAGACRNAFDRINFEFMPCAAEQLAKALSETQIVRDQIAKWATDYPRYAEPLKTRLQLIDQNLTHTKILLDFVSGKTKRLGK